MAADADSIDDLDVVRSGGMPRLFGGVYAPATLGQFLRELWSAIATSNRARSGSRRRIASIAFP